MPSNKLSQPSSQRWPTAATTALLLAPTLLWLVGCQPKVVVEPPKEPITINLNVKIEHEIRVKVDEDLDDLFATEDGLF